MYFELLSQRESIIAEMSVHVPFCVHKDPQNVLFVTHHSEELAKQVSMHNVTPKFSHDINESKFFDIIILDELANEENFKKATSALKYDGIIVARSAEGRIKDDLTLFDGLFRIVMPYHNLNFIFASNIYHPTADIILQKSDLLDRLYYYNSEIHTAEFALPTKIREFLKAQLKN
jgi:spermidine synthase